MNVMLQADDIPTRLGHLLKNCPDRPADGYPQKRDCSIYYGRNSGTDVENEMAVRRLAPHETVTV